MKKTAPTSLEEQMIRSLIRRKREYERYFKASGIDPENPGMDNQATNAYTGLIKTIAELSRKAVRESKDPEEVKRLAEEILETEYGIKR